MNSVAIAFEGVEEPPWREKAVSFIERALRAIGRDNWDLSVLFCGAAFIRGLNRRYRGMDAATDVLSFTLGEECEGAGGETRFLPGDIVVSLPALAENAREFAVSPDEELRRLLIHGILHLDGMDHATNAADEPMLQKQEALLLALALDNPNHPNQTNQIFTP